MSQQGYRATRQAWIDGVLSHYPGEPKASYIKSWETMDEWEREAVKLLYEHVKIIILPSLKAGINISPEHGGYLVCSVWNAIMYQLLREPKPSYIKHFDQLDTWQQKTDICMYQAIEASVLNEVKTEV